MSELFDALQRALADRYTLERELGAGGMDTVYLAGDVKHRRKVAIKVLHPELAAAIGPDRFRREIDIAAALQHPHILPLHDSGNAAGHLYYVMPFVEGESVRDRLKREQQLPQEDVVKIVADVASALGYAHSRGIVHRDIKPENIMLSGGSAVVTDFGIARPAAAANEPALTKTGTVIGTPLYMSPEQCAGGTVDGRSDQYSLACVAYEMLVGEPPFTGPNVQSIIARHSLAQVSPPSIIRASIPETMERALLKALEKTPADRFPTTITFAEAFAAPSRVTAAQRPQLPRPRRLLVWGIPMLVLLLAGGGWLTRSAWRHRAGTGSTEGRSDPRTIAVLYFADQSPNKTLGYLGDGLTESLINDLGQVGSLKVISRYGVAPYRNSTASPDSLSRALHVGTLVKGTVSQAGSHVRVTVDMINTADGTVQRSGPIEREDVLGVQDALTDEVSQFLRARLGQAVQQIQSRSGARNAEAWELVQRAQREQATVDSLVFRGDSGAARRALARADSELGRAAQLDPQWVLPIVNRGWAAYDQQKLLGWDKSAAAIWSGRALELAAQALRQGPRDPEALRLRGTMRYLRFLLALDPHPFTPAQLLDSAEADLRAGADSANPNRAAAWSLLSHLYGRKSDPAAGKLAAMNALDADPYLIDANVVMYRLFTMSVDLEDPAGAERWGTEGGRRFPKDPYFTECQFELMAIPGQTPDVAKAWRAAQCGAQGQCGPSRVALARRRDGRSQSRAAVFRGGAPQPHGRARRVAAVARTVFRRQSTGPDDDGERRVVVVARRPRGPTVQAARR